MGYLLLTVDEQFSAFVAAKRAEQDEIRKQLAPYESGSMYFFSGPSSGQKHDITAQVIARMKGEIASIERTIEFLAGTREGADT